MLDINLIRSDPKKVSAALMKKDYEVDFSELLQWDISRRELIRDNEQLKAKRNKVSAEIPKMKKQGLDVAAISAEMKLTSEQIRHDDLLISEFEEKINEFLALLPNIPADDVVAGDKENNEVIRVYGEPPSFSFEPKNHIDLVKSLDLVDYERGAKVGGHGFWMYKGDGALLEWALINYFIDDHIKDGYEFILPPHILNYQCGYTAGQFPKFEGDVFSLVKQEGKSSAQFLLPTAETVLVNVHRDEILDEDELPKKYFAYTPCYRREAGSARTEERGMIRGHQFNKVELVNYTMPENSDNALEGLVEKAERLMKGLGLHYRVSKLAAQDCSYSMAKTYDIEVWIPSMGIYKEVSSASNAMDYQARRGNMKFRRKGLAKSEFMHTLNASGLATSRVFPAMLEQLQMEDGSVKLPPVLAQRLGKDVLYPI
ncbi:MAG: serine--tRNA ligase [Oscillospiraceae bacterium]|nr:serine--tRNA ligase [Oscillospiraceae bacterium]